MHPQNPIRPSVFPWPLLVIGLAALAVVCPFFWLGNPSGHDFEFHLHSWMEVLSQWRQGILYPRWAALANHGYGEARFLFYPPLSWMLGAMLGVVLPWKAVPGAFVWLALTLSGCSMFALARRWLNRNDAILAATLYAANPYFILIVYWRSAFAELLAGAWLPLILLYTLALDEEGVRSVVPLSLTLAAVWLTNAPAAVMANYSLVLLALVGAVTRRWPRILLLAGTAAITGASLAAFYIVPASYEQRWVNIAQVLAPGVRPQDNFLFTTIADPEHTIFNLLVSVVAAAEIAILAIAGARARRRIEDRQLWLPVAVWASAAAILMFFSSTSLWQHLPLLRYLQLPWRLLLCLNVAFGLFLAMDRQWFWRTAACLAMLGVLVFGWQALQAPWWDTAAEIRKLAGQHQSISGYEGTDEYIPAGADAYDVNPNAPPVSMVGGKAAQVQIQRWNPEEKTFTANLVQPGQLALHLFDYPAWQVEVNGREVETVPQEDTGQMLVPVQAGENRVRVIFIRTWDRTWGGIFSAVAMIALFLAWIKRPKHRGHEKHRDPA